MEMLGLLGNGGGYSKKSNLIGFQHPHLALFMKTISRVIKSSVLCNFIFLRRINISLKVLGQMLSSGIALWWEMLDICCTYATQRLKTWAKSIKHEDEVCFFACISAHH